MKTTHLHIFEFQQLIKDSPFDQSIQAQLADHLAGCAQCSDNSVLLHEISNIVQYRQNKIGLPTSPDSELIEIIMDRTHHKRFFSGLLKPLPGLAWILIILLMVLLLSWGITRLIIDRPIVPINLVLPFQQLVNPTDFHTDSGDCRPIIYTVDEGDTLLAISIYFNQPVDVIWRKNALENNSILKPGMSISIPFCGWITPIYTQSQIDDVIPIKECPLVRYKIQESDTLESISVAFDVSVAAIISDNHLENDAILSPGEILAFNLCKNP